LKPPQFEYFDPTSVDEVLALLREYGEDAKLLAGGQSLMPVLNMRLARPKVLIDLGRVDGLAYIRREGEGLVIGAMTRHSAVARSPLVAQQQPLLQETMQHVGHIQIRNRGTVGGSLVHADPAAELPAVMVALDATMRIRGADAIRDVAAADFFVMYFTTCIRPDELLMEVRVPVLPLRTGYAFVELARRHGDFALGAVACTLTLSADGKVEGARLGLVGVGMTPVRAAQAEDLLRGRAPEPALFAQAADAVRQSVMPDGDVHASAEYRQHLAGVLTEQALGRALERARSAAGGGGSL